MTKPCYYFVINLLIISGVPSSESRFLSLQSLQSPNHEVARWGLEPPDKLISVKSGKGKRFFEQRSKKQLSIPIGISQETFPPSDMVAESNDEIYARYFRWKDDSQEAENFKMRDKLKSRYGGKSKKEIFKRAKKRYLDYTNSQMPFNEGTRASKFTQMEKSVAKNERENNIENFEGIGDDISKGYSRVRRFLDQERAKKRMRASSTLEAKEAAMSRVLDPNLNSEGTLEPHVRKRRDPNSI